MEIKLKLPLKEKYLETLLERFLSETRIILHSVTAK
jgi:hypothetical protein